MFLMIIRKKMERSTMVDSDKTIGLYGHLVGYSWEIPSGRLLKLWERKIHHVEWENSRHTSLGHGFNSYVKRPEGTGDAPAEQGTDKKSRAMSWLLEKHAICWYILLCGVREKTWTKTLYLLSVCLRLFWWDLTVLS